MISFDDLFLKSMLNSFADVIDCINLNMYLDFKNLTKIIFMAHEDNLLLFKNLKELGLTYHVFIDILYFIEAIVNHMDYIVNCAGH